MAETNREAVLRLKAEGKTVGEIVVAVGVTRQRVYQVLASPGPPARPVGRPRIHPPQERRTPAPKRKTPNCRECGAPVTDRPKASLCLHCRAKILRESGIVGRMTPGSGRRLNDLTGRTFGRWTVLRILPRRPNSCQTLWLCRCECGHEGAVPGGKLGLPRETHQGSSQCAACHLAEKVSKPCVVCGTDFTGTKRSRYCSPKCQKEAAAKRKADRHAAGK